LLILVTGLQTFSSLWLILDFRINRDYIAAKLCVNRQTPGSCCKGKCYLKKQLAEHQDQQPVASNGQRDEVPLFAEEPDVWHFALPAQAEQILHPYRDSHSSDYSISVFEPPQA
jgi:hypothetical protein